MNKCGVCQDIVLDKQEALQCDGECTKWYHCICVGMSSGQYETFRDDYDRHNVLQWLCDSCKDIIRKPAKVKCLSHGAR